MGGRRNGAHFRASSHWSCRPTRVVPERSGTGSINVEGGRNQTRSRAASGTARAAAPPGGPAQEQLAAEDWNRSSRDSRKASGTVAHTWLVSGATVSA